MDAEDKKYVEQTAELSVRRYFDHFLEKTLPTILENHVVGCPHGKRVSRVKWALIGAVVMLVVLVPTIGKPLITMLFKI